MAIGSLLARDGYDFILHHILPKYIVGKLCCNFQLVHHHKSTTGHGPKCGV